MKITELEPKQLWANFASLNAVPRPSKKEEKVIAFMVAFGDGRNGKPQNSGATITSRYGTPKEQRYSV